MTRSITLGRAFSPELVGERTGLNDPRILRAAVPAVGVVASAAAMARTWSRTVVRTGDLPAYLDDHSITDATHCLAEGPGALDVPGPYPRWGTGFMLDSEFTPMLTERSFGHDGAGGQLAFADPGGGVGFAFLTNRLRNLGDTRASRLVSALR